MSRAAAVLSGLGLVWGLGLLGLGAQAAPKDDLLAADRAFSKLTVARGRNYAALAFLMDSGRLYGEAPVAGRAQAFRRLARGRGRGTFSWAPETATVSADGALGWTDGNWLYQDGKTSTRGHYLSVWMKRGGRWKVRNGMAVADGTEK